MFVPVTWQPTIAEYIEAWHSQADLSRKWMGEAMVNEFDVELEAMLTWMFPDGRCQTRLPGARHLRLRPVRIPPAHSVTFTGVREKSI